MSQDMSQCKLHFQYLRCIADIQQVNIWPINKMCNRLVLRYNIVVRISIYEGHALFFARKCNNALVPENNYYILKTIKQRFFIHTVFLKSMLKSS